jgi:hypothetical protein
MKKSRNRKTKYFNEYFYYKDEKLKILASESLGVYKEILIATIEQLDTSIAIHKKIMVLIMQLHTNTATSDNKRLSNFMNNTRNYLNRDYGIKKMGFSWARERSKKESTKSQHYHLGLFLDGNKIQHPKKLNETLKEKWSPFGSTWKPTNCFYFIDKNNIDIKRPKAIERLSYLAKIKDKGFRDPQAKDYGTSRLKMPLN